MTTYTATVLIAKQASYLPYDYSVDPVPVLVTVELSSESEQGHTDGEIWEAVHDKLHLADNEEFIFLSFKREPDEWGWRIVDGDDYFTGYETYQKARSAMDEWTEKYPNDELIGPFPFFGTEADEEYGQ